MSSLDAFLMLQKSKKGKKSATKTGQGLESLKPEAKTKDKLLISASILKNAEETDWESDEEQRKPKVSILGKGIADLSSLKEKEKEISLPVTEENRQVGWNPISVTQPEPAIIPNTPITEPETQNSISESNEKSKKYVYIPKPSSPSSIPEDSPKKYVYRPANSSSYDEPKKHNYVPPTASDISGFAALSKLQDTEVFPTLGRDSQSFPISNSTQLKSKASNSSASKPDKKSQKSETREATQTSVLLSDLELVVPKDTEERRLRFEHIKNLYEERKEFRKLWQSILAE